MLSFNRHNSPSGKKSSPPRTRWWNSTGFTSALGVVAGAAQAETVQITLTGNQISNSLGNTLDIDLTGDGIDDLKSTSTRFRSAPGDYAVRFVASTADDLRFEINAKNSDYSYFVVIQGTTTIHEFAYELQNDVSTLLPIAFTDVRINAGAETNGLLEVRARNLSNTDHQISLLRLVFDDESTDEPTGATVGGMKPEWVPPVVVPDADSPAVAENAILKNKIRKLKRSYRKAKRRGNRAATMRIRKKIRKIQVGLRAS